jgi:hypothetical protein
MNAKQVVPVLAKLAPVLVAAGPPVIIGAAIGGVILWLLSRGNNTEVVEAPQPVPDVPQPAPVVPLAETPAVPSNPPPQAKRVRREDVAEALAYGARSLTRTEAVTALQNLGFGKTAAYKALSPDGRFASLIRKSSDGLLEWQG